VTTAIFPDNCSLTTDNFFGTHIMHCWSQSLLIVVVVILGTLNIFNAACGQKGRLTLPDTAPGAAIPVVPAAPASATTQLPSR
jgi:predicted small lipoprotein YifL